MSDDSDLMIAAAATAALVTWMGTRHHEGPRRDWAATLAVLRAALRRTWHETPGYVLIQAIRQALRRPDK